MNREYISGNVTGIKVYIDGYVIYDDSMIYMSAFAGADSVKSFNAGFLSNMDVYISNSRYERSRLVYKMWTQKLTQTITHGLVFVEELFDLSKAKACAVIIGATKKELLDKTFAFLESRTTVPLLENWKQQIVIDMVERTKLESFGVGLAYYVTLPDDNSLEEYVKSNLESLKKNM